MPRRKAVIKTIDEQIEELRAEIEEKQIKLKELEKEKKDAEKEALYQAMQKMNLNVESAVQKLTAE